MQAVLTFDHVDLVIQEAVGFRCSWVDPFVTSLHISQDMQGSFSLYAKLHISNVGCE
jgi:hypothetical protein